MNRQISHLWVAIIFGLLLAGVTYWRFAADDLLALALIFFVGPVWLGYFVFAILKEVSGSVVKRIDPAQIANSRDVSGVISVLFWLISFAIIYLVVGIFSGWEFIPDPFQFLLGQNWFASGLTTLFALGVLVPLWFFLLNSLRKGK